MYLVKTTVFCSSDSLMTTHENNGKNVRSKRPRKTTEPHYEPMIETSETDEFRSLPVRINPRQHSSRNIKKSSRKCIFTLGM